MIETLEDTVRRLDELGIEYMITGSVAMSSYVVARTTMDIDVVIEIANLDADNFERKFLDDYYVDVYSIRSATEHRSMFNIINLRTGFKVDLIIKKQGRFEREKFSRRRLSKINGTEFWVIDKEDLILSKLRWAQDSLSEIQFRDVRNLLESGSDELFLQEMITREGLTEVWNAFESWKIRIEK